MLRLLRRADVALVLGNTVEADGTLSPRLAARVDESLRLYREGYFPLIVVSGAVGQEGHDEALAMKADLVSHGVPASAVIADSDGINTHASAMNLKRLMTQRQLKSAFVVSQYFHVPRCRLALRRFGIDPVFSSHAHHVEWRDLFSVPREVLGYAEYAMFKRYDPP